MSGGHWVGEYHGAGIRDATTCGFVYKYNPEDENSRFLQEVGIFGNETLHISENHTFRQ